MRTEIEVRRHQLLLSWTGAANRRGECAALHAGPKRPNPRFFASGLMAQMSALRTVGSTCVGSLFCTT